MKKFFALLLVAVMLSAMAVTAFAENYDLNSKLSFIVGGGAGVSLDGTTVSIELEQGSGSSPAYYSSAQLAAQDDLRDGFSVKISDIQWDTSDKNPAIVITYGNTSRAHPMFVTGTSSSFSVLVQKDGSVFLWGDGISSNHFFGRMAPIQEKNVTIGANATEFTYKLVPNADKTFYTFYINDEVLFDYDATAPTNAASIFATPEKPCNFGFLFANGNHAGYSFDALPVGNMSFTIAEVSSTGGDAPARPVTPPETDAPATDAPATDASTTAASTTAASTTAASTTASADDAADANDNLVLIIVIAAVAAAVVVAAVIIILKKKKK